VRQIGLADSRLAHLARAITWIRGHYDQTLRVEDLAAMAAMAAKSATSFHRHFRALTSMTRVQFQKQIRLHEARTRLLADPGDIAGAGYAVGYSGPCSSAASTAACSACRPAATHPPSAGKPFRCTAGTSRHPQAQHPSQARSPGNTRGSGRRAAPG
jgi:AraC-like DNA-binding protein